MQGHSSQRQGLSRKGKGVPLFIQACPLRLSGRQSAVTVPWPQENEGGRRVDRKRSIPCVNAGRRPEMVARLDVRQFPRSEPAPHIMRADKREPATGGRVQKPCTQHTRDKTKARRVKALRGHSQPHSKIRRRTASGTPSAILRKPLKSSMRDCSGSRRRPRLSPHVCATGNGSRIGRDRPRKRCLTPDSCFHWKRRLAHFGQAPPRKHESSRQVVSLASIANVKACRMVRG